MALKFMLVQPRGRTPIYSCSGSMKSLFEFQIKLLSSWNRIFSAERGFVAVHTDGKKGYSLSNWPELEAKELNPEDGIWKPSRKASSQIQKIFLASPGGYDYEYKECWINGKNGRPAIRFINKTLCCDQHGQVLLPLTPEPDYFLAASVLSLNYYHWDEFQNRIPREIRIAVKRVKGHPIDLLRLLSAVPAFLTLSSENPGLLLYIATKYANWKTDALPVWDLRELSKLPRDKLIKRLGIAPKFEKILGKIPPQHLTQSCVRVLGDALDQPVFGKTLTHLKSLSVVLLELLECRECWPIITPALIHDILEKTEGKRRTLFYSQEAYVLILKSFSSSLTSDKLFPVKTLEEIPELLRNNGVNFYADFYGTKNKSNNSSIPPVPLLIKSAEIVPLTTLEDLRAESRVQKNCTDTHYRRICDGNCYFFKTTMSAPQRLTIRIEREGKTEPWLITDIRAFGDAQPIRTMIQWAVDQLRVPASIDFWPNDAWYLPVGQKYSFVPSAPSLGMSDLSTIPDNQTKKETC